MRRDVFQAIADPTRRRIIHIVAQQSLNLNEITANFNVSRPAISRHIRILTECGLIVIRREGRERYCDANLRSLHKVSEWVGHAEMFWTKKLDALDVYLKSKQAVSVKNKKQKK